MQSYIAVPPDSNNLVRATNLVIMIFVMIGALFKWFALGPAHPPWPSLLVVSIGLANSVYLARGGSDEVAAWVLVGLLMFGLVFAGYNSGGFGGPVLLLAPLIPITAVLLINALAGWVTVTLVFVILSGFFALHLFDALPANPNSDTGVLVGRYLAMSFSGLVATWIVWSFAETKRALLVANEALANTDHLTRIANRRSMENRLSEEVNRARRTDNWLSFVMTDVDHFKRYNDVNGHPAGDACLVTVAEVIKSCLRRPADMVGRYGGEEFTAILPDTDPEGALQVAEHMRQAMIDKQVRYDPNAEDMVSLTLGVVSCKGKLLPEQPELLVKAADDALYGGKEQGRNRVVGVLLEGDHEPDPENKNNA